MKKLYITTIMLCLSLNLIANNLHTIANPTAGVLARGEARITQRMFKNNGIVLGADVGLFQNFMIGVSYGSEHIIGDQKPIWYNKPDVKVKYRLIDETFEMPAFAIGIDTQGQGSWHNQHSRYDIKSKGAYLVASKNYEFWGLIGFDGGINYTFERANNKKRHLDIFAGMYKTIGKDVTFFVDYSAGLNDTARNLNNTFVQRGRGYMNTAFQINMSDNISAKVIFYDIFQNRGNFYTYDRALLIDYRWFF